MSDQRFASVVVAGAGPAGLAAAVRARERGAHVVVLDDNPSIGGQIWRSEEVHPSNSQALQWLQRFGTCGAERITGARVIQGDPKRRVLLVEKHEGAFEMSYEKLILATGARELFLAFPGWT